MCVVRCPKCREEVKIDIAKAIDSEGEVYLCPKCHYKFRYTEK